MTIELATTEPAAGRDTTAGAAPATAARAAPAGTAPATAARAAPAGTAPATAARAAPAGRRHRTSRLRLLLGYGVIAAVLPYLGLKALWLGGSMVGVPAGSPVAETSFVAANAVTALLDAAAIGVALALTHGWGLRWPAWLVLVPAWFGIGLLLPVVVGVANAAAASAATGGDAVSLEGGLVEPWVYVVAYTSFTVQGLLLTAAFRCYARDRWGGLVRGDGRALSGPPHPTGQLQLVLGIGGAVAALTVGAAHLLMAFGADGPSPGAYGPGWDYTARSGEVVNGVLALLAATGVLALLRRGPTWTSCTAAWTGSGAMFAPALLTLLAVATGAPLSEVTALNGMTQLVALLAGPALAVAALLRLVDGRGAAPDAHRSPGGVR
jgi:hypothetical protein